MSETFPLAGSLQAWLAEWRPRIDTALADAIRAQPATPTRLAEAMSYSLLAPGKRLRPVLALLAADAVAGTLERALAGAVAVEMVHCYSLIHDDLPAMDDDDLRRGRPTCHRQFDEATAILAGDGLLTLAFETLATARPEATAARCCLELARGAGVSGMVGGQMDDLLAERHPTGDGSLLESIHRRKTGSLILAALKIGALLGQRDSAPALPAWVEPFGANLGLAFQITDDLLDAEGTEEDTGKRVGKDAARGKLTYPALLGIAEARCRRDLAGSQAMQALSSLGERGDKLRQLVQVLGVRTA